jgi:hypothetical protein
VSVRIHMTPTLTRGAGAGAGVCVARRMAMLEEEELKEAALIIFANKQVRWHAVT